MNDKRILDWDHAAYIFNGWGGEANWKISLNDAGTNPTDVIGSFKTCPDQLHPVMALLVIPGIASYWGKVALDPSQYSSHLWPTAGDVRHGTGVMLQTQE